MGSEINAAEEEIVEEFERNRKDVNEALDALEDEIIATEKESKERGSKPEHKHTRSERREAERKHREQHDRKHMDEDKLQEKNLKKREFVPFAMKILIIKIQPPIVKITVGQIFIILRPPHPWWPFVPRTCWKNC